MKQASHPWLSKGFLPSCKTSLLFSIFLHAIILISKILFIAKMRMEIWFFNSTFLSSPHTILSFYLFIYLKTNYQTTACMHELSLSHKGEYVPRILRTWRHSLICFMTFEGDRISTRTRTILEFVYQFVLYVSWGQRLKRIGTNSLNDQINYYMLSQIFSLDSARIVIRWLTHFWAMFKIYPKIRKLCPKVWILCPEY